MHYTGRFAVFIIVITDALFPRLNLDMAINESLKNPILENRVPGAFYMCLETIDSHHSLP